MITKSVNSSMVEELGYAADKKELTVKFKNGSVYAYSGVEASVFEVIANAESVGKAFNSEIRGKYEMVKS